MPGRVGRRTPPCPGGHPAARAGGAGGGPLWVQPFLPVAPDLDINSSGALLVRLVD